MLSGAKGHKLAENLLGGACKHLQPSVAEAGVEEVDFLLFGYRESHFEAALCLREVKNSFDARSEHLPGEGRTRILNVGIEQTGILGDDDLGFGVGVVVWASMAYVDKAGVRVDITRFYDLCGPPGEQTQYIRCCTGAYIAFRCGGVCHVLRGREGIRDAGPAHGA